MAKPEWGTKRSCQSCGAKFYDFNRDPIACPNCGTVYLPEAALKPRRPRVEPKPKLEKIRPPLDDEENVGGQGDEDLLIEDEEDEVEDDLIDVEDDVDVEEETTDLAEAVDTEEFEDEVESEEEDIDIDLDEDVDVDGEDLGDIEKEDEEER